MPRGSPSAAKRPLEVRRPSTGGSSGRTVPHRPRRKRQRRMGPIIALVLLLLALGIAMIFWAFSLPQQERTPTPSQYRHAMSISSEVGAQETGSSSPQNSAPPSGERTE